MTAEHALYIGAAALAGLLLGSFFNVCIYRVPRDLSIVTPRSFCPECGHGIAWYDNLPVLSYVLLRGRCRECSRSIEWRYPLVEVTTGVLFALVAIRYGWTVSALKWALFESLLVVLFWTDIEERILPDEFTIGGTAIGLVLSALVPVRSLMGELVLRTVSRWASVLNAAIGAILLALPLWGVALLYQRIRKREALGLGDVKLLVLLGVFLGFENGLTAVLIGTVAGAVIGLAYILVRRKDASTYELPFGSFLCLGAAVVPLISGL